MYKLDQEDASILNCANSLTVPLSLNNAVAGLFKLSDGSTSSIICGGTERNTYVENQNCFTMSEWTFSHDQPGSLMSSRIGSASLELDDGKTLWITGGYNSRTSEFVSKSQTMLQSFAGPLLPTFGLTNHCLEKVGPKLAILVGGEDKYASNHNIDIGLSWTIDIETMVWNAQANLNIPRSGHVCGVLKDYVLAGKKLVIAAGGDIVLEGQMTNTVELLDVDNENDEHSFAMDWRFGPDFPVQISNAAGATTADQLRLYVAGGSVRNAYNLASASMFQLDCANLECQWNKLDQELKAPSSQGIVLALPFSPMGAFNSDQGSYADMMEGK